MNGVNGWMLGFAIGAVVVLVVVALLLLMIRGARRVAERAETILAGLHEARDHTQALWEVRETNATIDRVNNAARQTREALEAKEAGA